MLHIIKKLMELMVGAVTQEVDLVSFKASKRRRGIRHHDNNHACLMMERAAVNGSATVPATLMQLVAVQIIQKIEDILQ